MNKIFLCSVQEVKKIKVIKENSIPLTFLISLMRQMTNINQK